MWTFLTEEIADKLNDETDWKKRTEAIEQLEIQLRKELENPHRDFADYVEDIIKKMLKMVSDINFKISLTSLRVIQTLTNTYSQ